MDEKTLERFLRKIHHEPNTGCWLWSAALSRHGYARMYLGTDDSGQRLYGRMHRVSYEHYVGPIPVGDGYHGTCVCHRCDVRCCVNPDHLFLGDQTANMRDCASKGRAQITHHRGERHGMSRLTEDAVRRVRALYKKGMRQVDIAASEGVTQAHVSAIVTRRVWKHVD